MTRRYGVELLALSGIDTQYMWTTWRKPQAIRIRNAVSAFSGEHAVPATSLLACVALWIENLPAGCDLNSLEAYIDGVPGTGCYVGPPVNGLSQFNVFLPPGLRTGLLPVRVEWHGRLLCPEATIRVIPSGPVTIA